MISGTLLRDSFSSERLERYFIACREDEEATVELYLANQALSEALYTSLMTLELVLRNSIHRELRRHFKRDDWYEEFNSASLGKLYSEIEIAKNRLDKAKKNPLPSRIISELTFGFWTALFNSAYEKELWKSLRFGFPHMPKSQRQRNNVANPLNQIRTLRNRTHHYEHIIWNPISKKLDFDWLSVQHAEIYMVLEWMNPPITKWTKENDRFESVLNRVKITHQQSIAT